MAAACAATSDLANRAAEGLTPLTARCAPARLRMRRWRRRRRSCGRETSACQRTYAHHESVLSYAVLCCPAGAVLPCAVLCITMV
jgi:hypothetical protein